MKPSLETRLPRLVLLGGLPAVVVALAWLWTGEHGVEVRWTLSVLVLGAWGGCALAARERVTRPLQVVANLLSALREGDFSVRGVGAGSGDALGLVLLEVNALGNTLQAQRLGAVEASALLRTVMAEIDVAVFAFDAERRLVLVNRGGERLLARPAERLLGRTAGELGVDGCLTGEAHRTIEASFPGGGTTGGGRPGRYELRRTSFRQHGLPHQLLVLSDVSRALREEERAAWQRLIRVLSHEINNSLAPIKSIARSLKRIVARSPRAPDCDDELEHGLSVIEGRSAALGRFMQAYVRLAQLPKPTRRPVDVAAWVQRVVDLEARVKVAVRPGPRVTLRADSDQLDQLLINLVRNAADAALATGGGVAVGWSNGGGALEVMVEDEGEGLADTANLFVPFFTTKPRGSGIGLALSRQIAEAHGGTLSLENRTDRPGCRARLTLPLADGDGRREAHGERPTARDA